MSNKSLTLSLVIPVFNEERHLVACLDAVAKQSEMPDEVIIVDNNSTDQSVAIVRQFKFVKLLREPRQHQAFAQKIGFDAARGEILGRIDADSRLPADWVARLKQQFADQPGVVALTGTGLPYDTYLSDFFGRAIFDFYQPLASRIAGHQLLWGANCALRRQAWQAVSSRVLQRGDIWEDYDLAFALAAQGDIVFIKDLTISTSFRAVHKPLPTQVRYQLRSIRTFYFHKGPVAAILLAVLCGVMMLSLPLILIDSYALKPLAGFDESI